MSKTPNIFVRSLRELKSTRCLAVTALLIAINVTLDLLGLSIKLPPNLRIGFGFLCNLTFHMGFVVLKLFIKIGKLRRVGQVIIARVQLFPASVHMSKNRMKICCLLRRHRLFRRTGSGAGSGSRRCRCCP